jgi:hypothetical protein
MWRLICPNCNLSNEPNRVLAELDPQSALSLQHVRLTCIYVPQEPLVKRVGDALWSVAPTQDKSATYWLLAASVLALAGVASARYLVKR